MKNFIGGDELFAESSLAKKIVQPQNEFMCNMHNPAKGAA